MDVAGSNPVFRSILGGPVSAAGLTPVPFRGVPSMPHPPPGFDGPAVEAALAALIRAMGLDPASEPELAETPTRVRALYEEIFAGLSPHHAPELVTFPRVVPPGAEDSEELVVVRDIPFYSLCVHHFVPFFGHAHVAFLPGEKLLGISGVARLLEHFARRPQLQEPPRWRTLWTECWRRAAWASCSRRGTCAWRCAAFVSPDGSRPG